MLTLTDCTITGDDLLLHDLEGAVVVVNGSSPSAIAQISVPDPETKKFRRVERVLDAVVRGKGREWVIQGRSEHLEATVGVPRGESEITYRIESKGRCRGCGS